MSDKPIIVTQEIEFDRPSSGRCWRAKIEWEIDVREAAIETPRGTKIEYDATIACGPTVEAFALIDSEGCEFASNGFNCLPDYVPYIKEAIRADVQDPDNWRHGVNWEERAVAEAIERYLGGEGQGEAEGIGRDGGKVVAR